jgi:hypothetical protein
MRRLIELITGEPLPPGISPYRLMLTAMAIAAIVYAVLVLTFALTP